MTLPDRVRAEAQRILDGAARRLVTDEFDGDALGTASRVHKDAFDDRADQGTPLVEREPLPVGRRADRDDDAAAA